MRHDDKFEILFTEQCQEKLRLRSHLIRKSNSSNEHLKEDITIASIVNSDNTAISNQQQETISQSIISTTSSSKNKIEKMKIIDEIVRDLCYNLISDASANLLTYQTMLKEQQKELLQTHVTSPTLIELQNNIAERIDDLLTQTQLFRGNSIQTNNAKQMIIQHQRRLENIFETLFEHYETEHCCALCKHNYKEYRITPCGHTFCQGCLEILQTDYNCCLCRKPFILFQKL